MENGLNVTLPAPAPLDCEPPVALSSSASLSSFLVGLVTRSMFMCFLQIADFLVWCRIGSAHQQCRSNPRLSVTPVTLRNSPVMCFGAALTDTVFSSTKSNGTRTARRRYQVKDDEYSA